MAQQAGSWPRSTVLLTLAGVEGLEVVRQEDGAVVHHQHGVALARPQSPQQLAAQPHTVLARQPVQVREAQGSPMGQLERAQLVRPRRGLPRSRQKKLRASDLMA